MIQMFVSLGFVREYLGFDKFQPFTTMATCLRLIASLLMQQGLYGEMQGAVQMLTYLKR